MNILLVNDDGIGAEGLLHLAQVAVKLGKVWIVAPAKQCSAMSHRITIRTPMELKAQEYPLPVEGAWSLDGMPADCVKIGIHYVMKEKPDLILSGINHGMNLGYDTFYSGTVSAAIEGHLNGIPAIAVSNQNGDCWESVDVWLEDVLRQVLEMTIEDGYVWNVNFPGCPAAECTGICSGVNVYPGAIFADDISDMVLEDGRHMVSEDGPPLLIPDAPEGTDVWAMNRKMISIGKLRWAR